MLRLPFLFTLILLVSFSGVAATATSDVTQQGVKSRPKIAVVLAGGGAKGAAHIGVLKALEEMHIPVDIVTGTSMGAYVGGLYATGMSADEIESFLYSVNWNDGYRDRVDRSERRVRDKEYEDRYQLTTDLGIRWGEIRASRGVVQGQNMLRILRETTGNLPPFQSFDQLAIPYRAVATDILELQPVVMDKGYLTDAMMASMSVPGALPPYEVNGHMLVDGGVTNNMPVDIARQMGADIIIAVDISSDYKNADDFTNFFTVADQLSNYLVRRSTQQQVKKLADQDVLIQPDVGGYSTTDFFIMPEAYKRGYKAANDAKQALSRLSLSTADYQKYLDIKETVRRGLVYIDEVKLDKISINNQTHYTDNLLENRLALKEGKQYSTEELEQSVQNLYALDRFELVTYKFDQRDGENILNVDVKEKSWGPNYMDFRFFLEDDFDTESQYSIGVTTNFTNLNSSGAELRLNMDMGSNKLFETELYTPLMSGQKLFATLKGRYTNQVTNIPIDVEDQTVSDRGLDAVKDFLPVTYKQWVGEAALGYQHRLWSEFKTGVRYTDGEAEVSNLASFGSFDYQRTGVFFNYRIDTLDDFSLPTKGIYLDLDYVVSHAWVGDGTYEEEGTTYETNVKLIGAKSVGRHTLVGNVDAGLIESLNSDTLIEPQQLGGFLHLSGIPRNSLAGENKLYGNMIYRYRWFDNDFGLFSSPLYLGASLEYGGVWSESGLSLSELPMYLAGSVFAGIDSPIGPIMFGYGRTERNYDSIYLIIGTTFD